MNDKIETIYNAIDEIILAHGKPRKEEFGGGVWDAQEEFKIYKKQIGERVTDLQMKIITIYFEKKFREMKK
jgi:hypothetical protein